jgi:nudix-type nucleoside diphosphatase (YffH/AdpP family)
MFVTTIQLPGGEVIQRDVEDHGEAVAVLPYDPVRRTATLVRQFRAPPFIVAGELQILELPAGRREDETPQDSARREVMEETGLQLNTLEDVVTAWTMAALSTERAHLFLATYSRADRVGKGGGLKDEQESIEVVEVPLSDLASSADAGEITDIKLLLMVQTLRLRRPQLFTA